MSVIGTLLIVVKSYFTSSYQSVRLSAFIRAASTEWIYVKFDIGDL